MGNQIRYKLKKCSNEGIGPNFSFLAIEKSVTTAAMPSSVIAHIASTTHDLNESLRFVFCFFCDKACKN